MSTFDTSLVNKSTPVQVEGLIVIIIGFFIVANITVTDITFHDKYVRTAISTCYPENQDTFCTALRQEHGLKSDAQLEIGNFYWNELARQGLFVGFIMFVIRMSFAWFLQANKIRKIRTSTILMAIFWGITGTGIFLFGFVDTFYYLIQGENFPNELAWLNNAGLFSESKTWFGDPTIVEVEDLFATNVLGLLVLGTFLFVVMYTYSASGMANRGIA